MSDEELLNELQIKAVGIGLDMRFLIGELIKRYKIKKFEVAALRERIDNSKGLVIPQSPTATAPFTQGSLER